MFTVESSLYVDISNLKHARAKTKQYDNGLRYITIFLNDNGKPLNIEDNAVKIYMWKSDGTSVLNNVKYIDVTNGIIEVEITSQMSAVAGVMPCELVIWDSTKRKMTTSYKFEIEVEQTYFNQSKVVSQNEFGVLGDIAKFHEENVESVDWIEREDGLFEVMINHNLNTSACFVEAFGVDGERRFIATETINGMSIKVLTDEAENMKVFVVYRFC